MYQTFDATTSPDQGPPRLEQLRDWLGANEIDGFLVPRADQHQGENVAPCDERLAWLTGFTGSAGFACVLKDKAGVFIDGRYRIQVVNQVADVFTPVHWPETKLADWVLEHATDGDTIGFDPWLHTAKEIADLEQALKGSAIRLLSVLNGVDAIWLDRPSPPRRPAFAQLLEVSGKSSDDKCREIGAALAANGQAAAVLTLPESICWLLNIRGQDVSNTPIVQAFAVIGADGRVALFGDQSKFSHFGPDPKIDEYDWVDFEDYLKSLTGNVLLDPSSAPYAAQLALAEGDANIVEGSDPCALPKACKNEVELEGSRAAHIRDGAAMCEFLAWFDAADKTELTEIDIVSRLEGFRAKSKEMRDISFETISGSGPNGAIVHYRVTHESNRALDTDNFLLVDSGAQYQDGTTDITRTLPLGQPTLDMRQAFTRVLQGMIALSMARFPRGVQGRDLDALARAPLWMAGQDYDHGTGHGVGSFLSVHEGPQSISRRSTVALEPGMIISNEPGYYRENGFGIRIENLVIVQQAPTLEGADKRDMLAFETLTLAPIHQSCFVAGMLTVPERTWLNDYHATVRETLLPLVSDETAIWLEQATARIA